MLPRWRVAYGPEFAQSKKAVDASPTRLKLHLDAIELALERDPFQYSQQYGEEHQRVISTDDFHDGFILTAFVTVRQTGGFVATIEWIVMRPLLDAFEPDPDDEND